MIVNKQGFTLVELLATIVVLGLIAGIATVAYTGIVNDSATRVFESYEDTMHAEAVYRLTNFYSDVNFVNNKAVLYLDDLQIEPINNPKDPTDKCSSSYVEVTRTRNNANKVLSMTYKVCLKCRDYESKTKNANGSESPCRIYND